MRLSKVVFSTLLMSGAVSAAVEPQGIAVGGASLIPTIRIQHQHDDNIFSSDILEESSTITNLTPRLEYYAEKDEQNFLSVTYDGDYARYWDSRDDDYDDHTLGIVGAYSGSDFFRLRADAHFQFFPIQKPDSPSAAIDTTWPFAVDRSGALGPETPRD